MMKIRKSNERGHLNHGWLETYHSFSFASYYDPRFTGFRDLLVINEDYIHPGEGFGKHGHRDMEIITYVMEGALEHRDSLGTGSVLRPGDVQRMSAGKGVHHSEFNHSKNERLHLFQIWISPSEEGLKPSYEEKKFSPEDKKNQLCLLVSPDGKNGSLKIHQDASMYASLLDEGRELVHRLNPGRHAWLQLAKGSISVNGQTLNAGDGAQFSEESDIQLKANQDSELILFDLP